MIDFRAQAHLPMPRQLCGGATAGAGQRMVARHVHRQFAVVGQRPRHQPSG
jgi:hypothetical protein